MGRGRNADGSPNAVDVQVGRMIRERRVVLGVTQERLALLLGITFQQVQKYERGANRVGASRLWALSQALKAPVEYFFSGCAEGCSGEAESSVGRTGLSLLRHFNALPAEKQAVLTSVAATLRQQLSV